MPRTEELKEKPKLNKGTLEDIKDALLELESFPSFDLSEADVASDNLASALITAFFPGRDNPFRGKTPALYEVIEKLHETFGLTKDAVEAAHKIKELIEDAYGADEDET